MKPKSHISYLISLISFLFLISPVYAQHFSSDSYIIDWGNFNITGGRKNSDSFVLTDTVGQNSPGQYTRDGYTLKSGFQYIHDGLNPFSFQIDKLEIDLGSLVPGVGSTANNILTITSPSGYGYQILVLQSHPLAQNNGTTIPDTTCNSGCTASLAAAWTDSSAYGFGYNVIGLDSNSSPSGIGTSQFFTDSTYYRPFASLSDNQTPQTIMAESTSVKNRLAQVTYKVNIAALQSAGIYRNAINFIAVPTY